MYPLSSDGETAGTGIWFTIILQFCIILPEKFPTPFLQSFPNFYSWWDYYAVKITDNSVGLYASEEIQCIHTLKHLK